MFIEISLKKLNTLTQIRTIGTVLKLKFNLSGLVLIKNKNKMIVLSNQIINNLNREFIIINILSY